MTSTGLRIVFLNAWGGKLWPDLARWIGARDFDVLCLQEVTRAIAPSGPWLRYRDAYRELEQRADLFGDVSRILTDWQGSFAPAARGPLFDGDRMVLSEHGLGCWAAPHLAVTGRRHGFVHGTFRADGWGPEPVPRAVQGLCVQDASDRIWIHQVHGLRDPGGKGDTPTRLAQADSLVRHIERSGDAPSLTVLGGDFNLRPDSVTFDVLTGIGLTDLVVPGGFVDTRTALYRKSERAANYCLVSDVDRVAMFDVPATPVVSDHRIMRLHLT